MRSRLALTSALATAALMLTTPMGGAQVVRREPSPRPLGLGGWMTENNRRDRRVRRGLRSNETRDVAKGVARARLKEKARRKARSMQRRRR